MNKISAPASLWAAPYVSNANSSRLLLVKDIIAVLCDNHKKLINALLRQNVGRLSLKKMEHIFTTAL